MLTAHCSVFRHAASVSLRRHHGVLHRTALPQGYETQLIHRRALLCNAAPLLAPLEALSETQLQQMSTFLDILLETNKNINLTAVRSKDEAWDRHAADSLALLPVIEQALADVGINSQEASLRVLDVGSGGGLPGMALAIARPHWHITMLDSLAKRCTFVDGAVASLGLPNARALWSRAEDAGQLPQHRQHYDVVVARAVSELRVLAELCLPFAKVEQGVWVAAKGPAPDAEVAAAGGALRTLGGQLVGVVEVASHSAEGARTAVVVRKARGTPKQYPRKPGTPSKRPL